MKYAAKRILMLLVTMLLVSFFTFAAFALVSGDPAQAILGTQAPAARPQAHPLVQILADLKPEALTPLEALKLVSQWKELFAGSAEGEGCDCQDAQACRNGQAGQEQRP